MLLIKYRQRKIGDRVVTLTLKLQSQAVIAEGAVWTNPFFSDIYSGYCSQQKCPAKPGQYRISCQVESLIESGRIIN